MQDERGNNLSRIGLIGQEAMRAGRAGFTLVELMVAVLLGLIAVAGIYKTYVSYSTAADVEEQTLELNQNLRVAMHRLVTELRMAGFDPNDSGLAGFEQGDQSSFTITMDLTGGENDGLDNDGDGPFDGLDPGLNENQYGDGDVSDAGERIRYFIKAPDANCAGYGLGREDVNAATGEECLNTSMDTPDPNPANVPRPLDFVYLNKDRGVITLPLDTPEKRLDVRYVQISMILRSTNEDFSYTNTDVFSNRNPDGAEVVMAAQNDHRFRRQLLAEVDIRNMALKDD